VNPRDVTLPQPLARRLDERARALLPLGTVTEERHEPSAAEREALDELAQRLRNTYPFPDPRYAGQMLKPPAAIAWAAYATAMLLNPNNHALDGGPATAEMEKEAVASIAAMFGLPRHLGHLTASGTIANLEALWVARELHPDRVIVSGANAHYTHARAAAVLGARHETLPEDALGRLDLDALEERLRRGEVGTVVCTPGTTALGAVDDIAAIAGLCEAHGARLHVDAAYGGFFALLADGAQPGVDAAPFAAIARADSVVVDPHKHGLQPYGCGCVLFADPGVGRLYAHDSPYTYFTSDDLHLGEISLECSRAGAAAAALWTTLRALPLTRQGLGRHLAAARSAALVAAAALDADPRTCVVVPPALDIVCAFAANASAARASAATTRAFATLAEEGWHVATLRVSTDRLRVRFPGIEPDAPTTTVLRCCLLKQGHAGVSTQLAVALAAHLAAALD
jgi:glutamate/tyrosine decarboxylase-like PLP-dependent enzyme